MGGRETEDKSMETEDKNEGEYVKTKGAHLGKFSQEALKANMITQPQNQRRSKCPRKPRILLHPWKGQGLDMKTTRHVTKKRKESLSLSE